VLGYDALTAGISQLPLAGALVVVAAVVPSVVARVGVRPTLVTALAVFAAGMLWLAAAGPHATFVGGLLGPSILIGVGLGAGFVTATQLAVDGASTGDSGLASGLVNTSQQIGGALGLAVLGTIAAGRTATGLAAGASTATALSDGFSWLFVGAAALAVIGAGATVLLRRR
jgi:MFS family permease